MDRPFPSSNNGTAAYLRVRALSMGVHVYTTSMRARLKAGILPYVDLVESTGSTTPYLGSGFTSIDMAHFRHGDMDTG